MSIRKIEPLVDTAGRTLARVGEDGLIYVNQRIWDHVDAEMVLNWLKRALDKP